MSVKYLHRVLDGDAAAWISVGWREVARDRVPSVAEDVVVIEWSGDGDAPIPDGVIVGEHTHAPQRRR